MLNASIRLHTPSNHVSLCPSAVMAPAGAVSRAAESASAVSLFAVFFMKYSPHALRVTIVCCLSVNSTACYIDSGASTPMSFSTFPMVCFAARHRVRRASRTAGSASLIRQAL